MTRRLIVYGAVFLLLAVLQEESAFRLTLWGVKPDLLLVFVVVATLQEGMVGGGASALVAAWFQAASTGIAVGSTIVSKAVSSLACAHVEPHVVRENCLTCMPVAFLATWLCEGIFFFFYPRVWSARWPAQVGLESLLNALLAPVIYAPIVFLSRGKENKAL
jgi:rod shape-determining protein MreD